MILVDTNVLVRLIQAGHPHHDVALAAMTALATREGEQFVVAAQTLYETYVVCTRPVAVNGLGMSPVQARDEIVRARGFFPMLDDTANIYAIWEGLIADHAVSGKVAHDARLVALMIQHKVKRILTFNDAELKRFNEVECVNPLTVNL